MTGLVKWPQPFQHRAGISSPLPTAPLGPALDESKFLILPIPYGGDDILTTVTLNAINCVLYVLLKLLICVVCCIAVQPKSLKQHHNSHVDRGSVSEAMVDHLIQILGVLDGDTLYNLPVPFPAIPRIDNCKERIAQCFSFQLQ